MNHFREIRSARSEQHLSQEELAKKVGCSQTALSLLENGDETAVSTKTLKRICTVLGIDCPNPQNGRVSRLCFCTQATCPKNVPYLVRGKLCFQPGMVFVEGENPAFCTGCGCVLADVCNAHGCGAQPQLGDAFCLECGASLVEIPKSLTKHQDTKQLANELLYQRKVLAESSEEHRVARRQPKNNQVQS
jgi:DNA-binding Xre family transcriptional regulator